MEKNNENDSDENRLEIPGLDSDFNEMDDQAEEDATLENDSDGPGDQQPNKKKSKLLWFLFGVIILSVIFFVATYFMLRERIEQDVQPAQDQVSQQNQEEPVEEKETHYLGILPLHNPSVMTNQFSEVEKYLNENTSLNVKLRLYPVSGELGGYTAVVKDVSEGNISFAYLASVTTVQANGNGPVIPFACAQKSGSPTYQGDLVVKVDSPYQTLEDLRGKKVSGTSKSSTSGNLMPMAWLKSIDVDPETYFEGGMMYLGSHDKAIEAVIKGAIDGAFINEATKNKFNKDEQVVRSIWRHSPVPEFPFVVNTDEVSPEELAEVKGALLKMHEDNQVGIQNINAKYEKWVAIDWEDYLGIKKAIDEVYGPVFYNLDEWGKD